MVTPDTFDVVKAFTDLGVAIRNLLKYFPDLPPQRLPFVPQNLDEVGVALKKVGVGIFYRGSKFDVGSGLQLEADPYIRVHAKFEGRVEPMDRVRALVEFARAMATLCEATVTRDIPQDGYHLRAWEGGEHDAWGQAGCCFFDFPETTPEEREQIAQQMGVDAVAFHFGKMFVYFFEGEATHTTHKNTLVVLNWSSNRKREELPAEPIFMWTKKRVNATPLFAFMRGLRRPPCWFLKPRWIRRKASSGGFILSIG